MTFGPLILKRAPASRLSGEWNDDDYDVLADRAVVDADLWPPTHGCEPTREAAMAAFAKSWRCE
jgi:hypothetical protein